MINLNPQRKTRVLILLAILPIFTEFGFAQQVKITLPPKETIFGYVKSPYKVVVIDDYADYNIHQKNKIAIKRAKKNCQIKTPVEELNSLFCSVIECIDNELSLDCKNLYFSSIDDFYNRIILYSSRNKKFFSTHNCWIYKKQGETPVGVAQMFYMKWDAVNFSMSREVLSTILRLSPKFIFAYTGEKKQCYYCVFENDVRILYEDKEGIKNYSVIKDTVIKESSRITFDDMPKEVIDNFDRMGIDNNLLLNDYEADYLNCIFKSCRGNFDFKGKRVDFSAPGVSKVSFFKGERNRYLEKACPTTCDEFITLDIGKYNNCDAIISLTFWHEYDTKPTKRRK